MWRGKELATLPRNVAAQDHRCLCRKELPDISLRMGFDFMLLAKGTAFRQQLPRVTKNMQCKDKLMDN